MARLEIRDVSVTFTKQDRTTHALQHFNLTVEEGEFVSIVGPSGCGKSTLFNRVAGFLRETTGQVLLSGEPTDRPTPRIGVVFQEHALFPWLTVRENVEFGPRMQGVAPAQRGRRAAELLELVGLQGFDQAYPGELSGGMRQRVAIARALANDPAVLLMDEPFGALDVQMRRILQDELLRIWEETRRTILFVTHSIEEAVLLSDRVVVMTARPGRIKAVIPIRMGRPRSDNSAPFHEYRRQVDELLREEILQAYSEQSRYVAAKLQSGGI